MILTILLTLYKISENLKLMHTLQLQTLYQTHKAIQKQNATYNQEYCNRFSFKSNIGFIIRGTCFQAQRQ